MNDKTCDLRIWNSDDVQIVPQFLELLKATHQQSSALPKEIFLWKHRDNPIGSSIITYAVDIDSGKVVAMEALSPRRLFYNGQLYLGYESNDTSTHPDYGRRGLFTSLLKLAMEIANKKNASFLFGFPNSNSMRGFLKNGWKDMKKIGVFLKPLHPLRIGAAILTDRKRLRLFIANSRNQATANAANQLLPEDLEEILKVRGSWGNLWAGYRDRPMLEWRFVRHPYHSYEIIRSEKWFAFALIGQRGILRECRIVEAFSRVAKSEMKQAIKGLLLQIRERFNPDVISTVFTMDHPYFDSFVRSGFYKAPSPIMSFNYPLSSCPSNLAEQPWAITGTDINVQ
jgi:hypothetical protein